MHKTQDSPNSFSSPWQVSTECGYCLEARLQPVPARIFRVMTVSVRWAMLLLMDTIQTRCGPSASSLLTMLHVLPQSTAGGAVDGML